MGLFDKKPSAEELAAREANKEILEKFEASAAWGVKNPEVATQFIYDENMKAFVIVEGPEASYKEKNPWVIRFDEVQDCWLEVDEWWNESPDKFDKFHDYHILTMDKYDEVYWHYDFYMNFKTSHPFCEHIRYQMNWNTNVLMIPGFHIFARRGLELNGEYRGKDIRAKRIELEEYAEKLKTDLKQEMIFDIVAKKRPDSLVGKLKKDLTNDWYVSRVENVAKHVKRAGRIYKTVMAEK